MLSCLYCLVFFFSFISSYYIPEDNHNITEINSFAFGSCYNLKKSISKYTIFNVIDKHKPDVFMWLGDAAYVRYAKESRWKIVRKYKYFFNVFDKFNKTKVLRQYNNTKYSPDYYNFNKKTPVIGVWDDNDYGQNDGNKYFPYKEQMKEIFLDFLDEPKDSHRRQPNKAIYTTYSFGDKKSYKSIRVILLDVRYEKSAWVDKDRDMLGEEQWKWFEEVLTKANETFILIASGTQILPFDRLFSEAWLPEGRTRLFNLLRKVKKNGVLLLTGDIHNAQILRTPCVIPEIGYPLYEITSSGLGHYCKPNCDLIIDHILPSYYKYTPTINYYNYAQLDFDWGKRKEDSKVTIKMIDIDDRVRINIDITYDELTNKNNKGDEKCIDNISRRFRPIKEYLTFYLNKRENGVYFYGIVFGVCVIISVLLNIVVVLYCLCTKCRKKNKDKLKKE